VILWNLNRFSKFLHSWKAYEICYKTHTTLPGTQLTLGNCYTTFGNRKFKFLQTFMIQQTWKKMQTQTHTPTNTLLQWYLTDSNVGLWVCGLSSWLKTKSLIVSIFCSVRALRGLPLSGRLSTAPVSRNHINSLLAPHFVLLFSGNLSVNLFLVQPFKCKLFIKILSSSLNTMFIVE